MSAAVLLVLAYPAHRFGPDIVTRYTPSGLLASLRRADGFGAEWATSELWRRLSAAQVGGPWRADDAEQNRIDQIANPPSWVGKYERTAWWILGGSRLFLTDDGALWTTPGGMQPGPAWRGAVRGMDGSTLMLSFRVDRHVLREGELYGLRMDDQLVFVRWEKWRYLVLPDEMLDFCNDVNAGENLGDWHHICVPREFGPQDVDGIRGRPRGASLPKVPKQYRHWLLPKPILPTLTSATAIDVPNGPHARQIAGARTYLHATVHAARLALNLGSADGVFQGMRLYAPGRHGMAHVVSVQFHTCSAAWLEFSIAQYVELPPGAQLSTMAPQPVSDKGFWPLLRAAWYSLASDSSDDPSAIALKRRAPGGEAFVRQLSLLLKRREE